MGVLRV